MAQKINIILEELGLESVIPTFETEKIDLQTCMSLNDTQLIRLGVNTMGDRLRLNERIRSELSKDDELKESIAGTSDLSSRSQPTSLARGILRQRNILFGKRKNNSKKRSSSLANFDTDDNKAELEGGQSKGKSKKKAKYTNRTWTVTVVCLSNKNADKVPSPTEKDNLFKAGLGSKKIKFHADDMERDLLDKINSDIVEGLDNETVGFPQLKGCGGIELLKCNQNSRDLQVIDCTWSVKKLKDYLGNQAKLYVRPIQKDLDMEPVQRSCNSRSEVKCNSCFKTFSVKDIREHTNTCVMSKLNEENPYSDSDELLDPMLNCNDTVKDDGTSILLKDDEINVVAPATNTDATKSFVNQDIDHADDFCTSIPLSVYNMSNSASMVQQEEADICSARPENNNAAQIPSQLHLNCKSEQNSDLDHIIANGIDKCLRTEMNDPVEILRYFQGLIVKGRKLELQHEDTVQPEPDNHDGSTNFIMVDRYNILQTALEKNGATQETDLRKTLEVQFYTETASDYGGPRKEFFRLVLNAVYKKYFEKGLRSYMADDYTTVGKIMALSILQNGSLPTFSNEEILNDLFASSDPESICSKNLRIGLDSLGLVRTKKHYTHTKTVIGLLRPVFSEDGTNSRVFENATYAAFMRYLRVVASGRRTTLSLQHILEFVTGASEEPVLGFVQHPSIIFVQVREDLTFIPTANTCGNSMTLPRATHEIPLPSDTQLFSLYDYAFLNTYYGLI
ncbi:unnamed protein product [Mytilus coruscus]|uniref:HECT domain-containing protein n=1 Tax=Mytilus coruscus TaxID=42192 RepID=A0A6J8A218_MYTCO|nr:unnamed protein product [Mytilus coruscus]